MKTDQIVATLTASVARIDELEKLHLESAQRICDLEAQLKKVADRRGPKSDREMTDDDARRVMGGDMVAVSHKDAAEKLGLSYAQVYSARKGFTFKHIAKEIAEKARKAAETPTTPTQS